MHSARNLNYKQVGKCFFPLYGGVFFNFSYFMNINKLSYNYGGVYFWEYHTAGNFGGRTSSIRQNNIRQNLLFLLQ